MLSIAGGTLNLDPKASSREMWLVAPEDCPALSPDEPIPTVVCRTVVMQ